jgi:hypothetical protein
MLRKADHFKIVRKNSFHDSTRSDPKISLMWVLIIITLSLRWSHLYSACLWFPLLWWVVWKLRNIRRLRLAKKLRRRLMTRLLNLPKKSKNKDKPETSLKLPLMRL